MTAAACGPRVGVFHPGTQHSWQTALAFQEKGRLAWYATSVFYEPGRWPYKAEQYLPQALAGRLGREFRRRYSPQLDPARVRRLGADEWLETGARRLGLDRLARHLDARGNRRFGHRVVDLMAREPVDVVWGYNNSSLEVFRWARARGIRCVLDQTVGHPAAMNRVLLEERARHPEFFLDSWAPRPRDWIARQDEEVALADLVVCGSEFCADTMTAHGCPREKIRVVPYGYDETLFTETAAPRPERGRPVRCLFAGALDARKGAAYLLPAFERIPPSVATLEILGAVRIPERTFARYADRVSHRGQLPRPEVVRHFLDADLFVFPSLFEGSALVLYEAVGAGLGIVQTEAAGLGAADGENGVILGNLSAESLAEAIVRAVEDARIEGWKAASRALRPERSWRVYREAIRAIADG